MPTTDNLDIALIETSQSQKEVTANEAIAVLDAALCEAVQIACADGSTVITEVQMRAGAALVLTESGSPGDITATFYVWLQNISRLLFIRNDASHTAVIACLSGSLSVSVAAGDSVLIYCDGAEVYQSTPSAGSIPDFTGLGDTPTDYTGDAGKLVAVASSEDGLVFTARTLELAASVPGVPTASLTLNFAVVEAFSLPTNLAGSAMKALVAATASTTVDVQKNTVSIGSAVFAIAGTTAAFTVTATSFAIGDVLALVYPASPDATLANSFFNLLATRIA